MHFPQKVLVGGTEIPSKTGTKSTPVNLGYSGAAGVSWAAGGSWAAAGAGERAR